MPVIKSAKKALRQARKREAQNKLVKAAIKESVKFLHKAIDSGDRAQIQTLLPTAYKKIDKAAKRGLVHQNTAARQKSRLSKRVNKILQG